MAERRAGKQLADLHGGGANGAFSVLYKAKVLASLKSAMILPEVIDESKWHGGKHSFIDPEGQYIFAYLASVSTAQLFYNSKLVKPEEFKSLFDILQPRWKGRIIALDPTNTGLGATMQFFYHHPDLGPPFIRKLFGEMDVTFSREYRQMVDWLAQGKFAICVGCKETEKARAQGLPVEDFDTSLWKEGASFSAGGGTLRQRFSSTGFSPGTDRSPCKNTGTRKILPIPAEWTFLKTGFRNGTSLSKEGDIST
jgi:ABC-type Fe3+ transport system substrate-binding protein